jgi:hypothetical protein
MSTKTELPDDLSQEEREAYDAVGHELTEEEREARSNTEVVLTETSQAWVNSLVDKCIIICNELSGHPLRPYQEPFARRMFESLIVGDGHLITALFSRQSGKSETVANVVATVMLMFPRFARIFPEMLGKYKDGVLVGAFAPVDEQADTLFGRIVARLTSDRAEAIMADPDIRETVTARGRVIKLNNCKSECRKTTAHPRASIEGRTYHLILIDECQGADAMVVDKSIMPMGTATGATKVFTGTPARNKGVFYREIQNNKRAWNRKGRNKCNHFEADWKLVGKYDSIYLKSAQKEMLRLGIDSDEFKLSYRLVWLLEQGMYTTAARLEELGDTSMQSLVHAWHKTPVVVGIDCGRKQDKTIVTVVFVDWDHPDQFGYYHHRVLSWLDLEGVDWEEQYYRIVEYLRNYKIWKVGVDTNGLGDVVVNRLRHLMPDLEIEDLGSGPAEQSARWKHLKELMDRGMLIWPQGSKVRQLKVWRRFTQEMGDLEVEFKGPNMMGKAPNERNAHDDYPDSLSMACILTTTQEDEETIEVQQNFLYQRNRFGR